MLPRSQVFPTGHGAAQAVLTKASAAGLGSALATPKFEALGFLGSGLPGFGRGRISGINNNLPPSGARFGGSLHKLFLRKLQEAGYCSLYFIS